MERPPDRVGDIKANQEAYKFFFGFTRKWRPGVLVYDGAGDLNTRREDQGLYGMQSVRRRYAAGRKKD